MTNIRAVPLVVLMVVSSLAVGQEASKKDNKNSDLEKVLWDADLQWQCTSGAGPSHKNYKECVEFRSKSWDEQFFVITPTGKVETKSELIAVQSAAHPAPGVGPYPDDFKLMAVYGNFALATDHTAYKTLDANGQLVVTVHTTALRMFVKEDGKWRPAGAAVVPIVPQ
jgi:hypothetical protein